MKHRLKIHDRAIQDIEAIADYIARDNVPAARRWIDAAQEAMESLAKLPGMGAVRENVPARLKGLRTWPVKGFGNYLVCYLPIENGVEILRVFHGARDLERVFSDAVELP